MDWVIFFEGSIERMGILPALRYKMCSHGDIFSGNLEVRSIWMFEVADEKKNGKVTVVYVCKPMTLMKLWF